MKESAKIALSYVKGHAEELGIDDSAFENREFHVHVPAGAIPRTATPATMVTALASLLSETTGQAHRRYQRLVQAAGQASPSAG